MPTMLSRPLFPSNVISGMEPHPVFVGQHVLAGRAAQMGSPLDTGPQQQPLRVAAGLTEPGAFSTGPTEPQRSPGAGDFLDGQWAGPRAVPANTHVHDTQHGPLFPLSATRRFVARFLLEKNIS